MLCFFLNNSHNDAASVSPILFSVDAKRNEKSEFLMDIICVSFFLSSAPLRSSFVSVEFDFNDSLNVFVPISLILFPDGSQVQSVRKTVLRLKLVINCLVPDYSNLVLDSERC